MSSESIPRKVEARPARFPGRQPDRLMTVDDGAGRGPRAIRAHHLQRGGAFGCADTTREDRQMRHSPTIFMILVMAASPSLASQAGSMWDPDQTRDAKAEAYVAIGNTVYFVADDQATGRELWKMEASSSKASLVRDIWRGRKSGAPSHLTTVDGMLFFSADDGAHGAELWRSDGTKSGTVMVRDIAVGARGSYPASLTVVRGAPPSWRLGDSLCFTADDGAGGRELWCSDGTAAGTRLVKEIGRGPEPGRLDNLANVRGGLYASTPFDLWKSDGTPSGTFAVQRQPPPGFSGSIQAARDLAEAGGRLHFVAMDRDGMRLWTSDGTPSGTRVVSRTASVLVPQSGPAIIATQDQVFFAGTDVAGKAGLFRSDGTERGTIRVTSANVQVWPPNFGVVGETLYFVANDGVHGSELWKAGVNGGSPTLVADIEPGVAASVPQQLTAVGSQLFFSARTGTFGSELWRTDGTVRGTSMVADLEPGPASCFPSGLTEVAGRLYFFCSDQGNKAPRRRWRTDGSPAGTVAITGIPESADAHRTIATTPVR